MPGSTTLGYRVHREGHLPPAPVPAHRHCWQEVFFMSLHFLSTLWWGTVVGTGVTFRSDMGLTHSLAASGRPGSEGSDILGQKSGVQGSPLSVISPSLNSTLKDMDVELTLSNGVTSPSALHWLCRDSPVIQHQVYFKTLEPNSESWLSKTLPPVLVGRWPSSAIIFFSVWSVR